METESHETPGDTGARLARAQHTVVSAATRIKNALGSIITLAGTPPQANQPLWRRLDVFARTDLGDTLSADAQADIADRLRPLVSLHNRLTDARWEISTVDASQHRGVLTGHGSGSITTTTIDAIDLLAEVFTTVADAIESLDTRLTAQSVFSAPIPISVPAYVREIQASTARISTAPDAVWLWESHLDDDDPS